MGEHECEFCEAMPGVNRYVWPQENREFWICDWCEEAWEETEDDFA